MCVQATMLAEHVIEHVAARLGLDPVSVRERNFLQLPGQLPAVSPMDPLQAQFFL